MSARSPSIGLLTALLMAWTAIWCCCLPTARADAMAPNVAANQSGHSDSCCATVVATADASPASHCPADTRDDCPLLQLRQTVIAPVWPALPMTEVGLALLPDWLMPLPIAVTTPVFAGRSESAGPPRWPSTLFNLHTSLLW